MDRNNSAKHIEEIEKITSEIDNDRKAFEESCSFLRYHWKGSNADTYIKKANAVKGMFEEVTRGLNRTVKSMSDDLENR